MSESVVSRRRFLGAAVIVPFSGLLHHQAGSEIFTLPTPAWRALASATVTARRVIIHQDISAGSAAVMARFIGDCPEDVSFYVNLYFGIHEPTPEMEVGRLWFSDPRRLEEMCAFLRWGGCVVEEDDGWTVLTRRTL